MCPSPEFLYPCKCHENNSIICGGTDSLNLKRVFENIDQNLGKNEKNFTAFYLNNTAITEIEENTFLVTQTFSLGNTPIVNSAPNHDVFLALSLFINLHALEFSGTQISEIPSYAFRPIIGIQSKLYRIYFNDNKIEKIGNYSFYDLEYLKFLDYSKQSNQININEFISFQKNFKSII